MVWCGALAEEPPPPGFAGAGPPPHPTKGAQTARLADAGGGGRKCRLASPASPPVGYKQYGRMFHLILARPSVLCAGSFFSPGQRKSLASAQSEPQPEPQGGKPLQAGAATAAMHRKASGQAQGCRESQSAGMGWRTWCQVSPEPECDCEGHVASVPRVIHCTYTGVT